MCETQVKPVKRNTFESHLSLKFCELEVFNYFKYGEKCMKYKHTIEKM